ncbi:MAG TPA: SRPBCC domain-containing protein [Solirubrobacteraceae bacterium]|nr:SRPBCC domain-containing protein [Solirubrobacteraceae bacterium]
MSDLVTRSLLIPAPPADVWDALTEPSRLAEWFADEVEADALVPDAPVVFRWDDGRERHGVVEEVDGPDRLVFRWSGADGLESQVAFDLVEEAAGTRVTVVESGLTRRAAAGRGAAADRSWDPRLRALALFCASAVAA